MKRALLILLFACICQVLFAQVRISGMVKSGNQVVPGANVSIKNSYDGTTTNAKGEFSFTTEEKGDQVLVCSFIGYETKEQGIKIESVDIKITIQLKEKANELNTVDIVAGTFEATDAKKAVILNSIDIATTAGAEADIFSAIQTLPGTQAAAEQEGLFVRGGAASETRTYFDGMAVQNPFFSDLPDIAQRGRFSPFMFKGTTFSAGGYSAVYGQALSSALILDSKDLPEKSTTDIGLMMIGGSLGHTERFKKSSLNLNAGYVNLYPAFKLIKQNIDWTRDPDRYSAGGMYMLKTSETGIIKVFSEYSSGKAAFNYYDLDNLPGPTALRNRSGSNYTNATYQEYLNTKWKINSGISYNYENSDTELDTNKINSLDQMAQARIMLTRYIGNLSSLKFGGEVFKQDMSESFNNLERGFDETLSAGFVEGDVFFTHKLVARVGLRAEYSEILDQSSIAPRTSIAYKIGKTSQISFAYGQFYQTPIDDYVVLKHNLQFEEAQHYILNYQIVSEKQTFRIEGYYKDYQKLIKTDPTEILNNTGKGYAQGIDVFWRDKKTLKRADYWISYSFLDTKRDFKDYPKMATPTFAAAHTVNIVYKQYIPKIHSQLGATYTFATGRTYFNPNNPDFLADKTKVYQNFSMNLSYLTTIKEHFTVVFLSLGNIPGFRNTYGYRYSADGSARRPIEPAARRTVFIGMFISIGDDNVLN